MSADTAQPRDPVTKDELAEDAARGSGHKNENANDDGEKYKVENANDDGEKEKKRVRKRGGGAPSTSDHAVHNILSQILERMDKLEARSESKAPPTSCIEESNAPPTSCNVDPQVTNPRPLDATPEIKAASIKDGMRKLGLEMADPATYPEPRLIRWYLKEMADMEKAVGVENVLINPPISQPLFWGPDERVRLGLSPLSTGGSSLTELLRDELVQKNENHTSKKFLPVNPAQFVWFLQKVLLVGTICGNFDRHGGHSSFNCYLWATVQRACSERAQTVALADSYIREHLHLQSAAGKSFDLATEADRIADRMYDKARREVTAHWEGVEAQKKAQSQKSNAKGGKKGWVRSTPYQPSPPGQKGGKGASKGKAN